MKIRGQTVYPLKERLLRLSLPNELTGCIEWKSATRSGYGRLIIGSRSANDRRSVSAHRLSYEINKGAIPNGMYVCHSCDNRKCINPDHLFLGTHQDNVDDRESKGRNKPPRKLSDEDVAEIRILKKYLTAKAVASIFNVSRDTIKHIWCGKERPNLPNPPTEAK